MPSFNLTLYVFFCLLCIDAFSGLCNCNCARRRRRCCCSGLCTFHLFFGIYIKIYSVQPYSLCECFFVAFHALKSICIWTIFMDENEKSSSQWWSSFFVCSLRVIRFLLFFLGGCFVCLYCIFVVLMRYSFFYSRTLIVFKMRMIVIIIVVHYQC